MSDDRSQERQGWDATGSPVQVSSPGGVPLQRNRDGTWSEPAPPRVCINGHDLGPFRVTHGVSHCRCGILHRTARCNECGAAYYLPSPTAKCEATALDGRKG